MALRQIARERIAERVTGIPIHFKVNEVDWEQGEYYVEDLFIGTETTFKGDGTYANGDAPASQAINHALEHLTPDRTSKERVVLNGNFVASNVPDVLYPLRIPGYTAVQLNGRIICAPLFGNPVGIKLNLFEIEGDHVELRDGELNGNNLKQNPNADNSWEFQNGIKARKVSDLIVDKMWIHNFKYGGIRLAQCRNVTLEGLDLTFNERWDGVSSAGTNNLKIRNCYAAGNRVGFNVQNTDGLELIDSEANLNVSNPIHGGGIGFNFATGVNYYLKWLTAKGNMMHGMNFSNSLDYFIGERLIAEYNHLNGINVDTTPGGGVIFPCHGQLINCEANENVEDGFSATRSSHLTLESPIAKRNGRLGIAFGHSPDGKIIGRTKSIHNGYTGIGFVQAHNCLIDGATVTDNDQRALTGGILISGSDDCEIVNSLTEGNGLCGVLVFDPASNRTIIHHNRLLDALPYIDNGTETIIEDITLEICANHPRLQEIYLTATERNRTLVAERIALLCQRLDTRKW